VRRPQRAVLMRVARLAAAALALLLALAFFFVAEDVRRWPGRLEAADVRYLTGSGSEDWEPADRLPIRFGDDLLALDDDLAFRRALMLFRREHQDAEESRPTSERIQRQTVLEQTLIDAEEGARDRRRRAQAANLLGVLYSEMAQSAGPGGEVFVDRALAAWRRAVIVDPANLDAKVNLELMLTLLREPEELRSIRFGRGASQRGGGQVGLRPPGEGY
jgi:hypothetical protein